MIEVLVIDDEPDMCAMMDLILSGEGFDVVTAEGGRAALALANRKKFDVAVTDLRMPDMNGLETLIALTALDPTIAVIVVTGHASDETIDSCKSAGAVGFVKKPFDMDKLVATVRSAAEASKNRGGDRPLV